MSEIQSFLVLWLRNRCGYAGSEKLDWLEPNSLNSNGLRLAQIEFNIV